MITITPQRNCLSERTLVRPQVLFIRRWVVRFAISTITTCDTGVTPLQ